MPSSKKNKNAKDGGVAAALAKQIANNKSAYAHFYGVPDLDLDTVSSHGLKAGERGYHFAFDTFPRRYPDPTPGSDNVIVAGYEGGLEVYSVSKRGLDPVASLKGLRGEQDTPGPVAMGTGAKSSAPGSPRVDAMNRFQGQPIEHYQTTIEVYSLRTNQRIDVLLQASQIPIEAAIPITSHMFSPPSDRELSHSCRLRSGCGFLWSDW
ncbi:unnamed protein product [Parascedosporium putredinis]|uniref:Uncharacterized protein n=1 Tax=Parascedosporium putredinis TaxID=1442378 RepID=A0A9P1M678_9PEZI|nr:unnamed protein product [Parascedosporium putredinis]CAI7989211.1 unnamed protein product [Parascedosporium putredinis]